MFAMECRKLGYEIEESFDFRGNVKGFEIKGVSPEIQERFSKRTRDIDDEIARREQYLGRTLTAAERHEISLETRSFKLTESDSESVRNYQLEQLSRKEMEILEKVAHEAYERQSTKENINLNEMIDEILPELFKRVSVLKEEQIIAEILTQNLGRIPLERLKKALANHREQYRLPGNYLVPEKVMETEQYAINAVEREKGLYQPLNEKFIPFNGSEKRKAQSEVIVICRSYDII